MAFALIAALGLFILAFIQRPGIIEQSRRRFGLVDTNAIMRSD